MQKLPIPEIGSVLDGYLFKGGDPNDPKSWEMASGQVASNQQGARPMPKVGEQVDGYTYKGGDPNSQDSWVNSNRRRGLLETANDTVITAGNAVVGLGKAAVDFVAPGSETSKALGGFIEDGQKSQSDVVQAERMRLQREVEDADGIAGEVGATLQYIARNPLQSAAEMFGSFGPIIGLTKGASRIAAGRVLAKGGTKEAAEKAGERAAVGVGVGVGAVAGGGDAAGEAYDLVMKATPDMLANDKEFQSLISTGISPEEAQKQLATEAANQARVIPTLVGGAFGAFGLERLAGGGSGYAGNAFSRFAKGAAVEGTQEAIEEGGALFEAQRAAAPINTDVELGKGVASAATMGAVLGAGPGGVLGALSPQRASVDSIMQARSVDEVIQAASDMAALDTSIENFIPALDAYRSKQIDEAEADPLSLAAPADQPNGLVTLGAAEGLQVSDNLLPASGGGVGQSNVPAMGTVSDQMLGRVMQDIAASGQATPMQEQFLRGIGRGDLLESFTTQQLQGQKRPDANKADAKLDEVSSFVKIMAREQTPAARAFTAQYNAGQITNDDVQAALFQQRRGGDEVQSRITAATEGRAATAQTGVQPANVMTPMARTPELQEAVRLYGNLPLTQADQRENFTTRLSDSARQAIPTARSAVDQASSAIATAAAEGQRLQASKGTGRIITLPSLPRPDANGVVTLATGGAEGSVQLRYVEESALADTSSFDGQRQSLSKNQFKAMQQIARVFGKQVQLYESETAGDGFVMPDTDSTKIFLNTKSTIKASSVMFHEMAHLLEKDNKEAYAALKRVVMSQATPEARALFASDYGQVGKDGKLEFNSDELVADTFGSILANPETLNKVFADIQAEYGSTKAQGIIARMAAALNKVINALLKTFKNPDFRAVGEFIGTTQQDLENLKAAVRQAAVAYAKQQRMSPMVMEGKIIQAERQVNLGGQAADTAENADPIGDNLENIRGLPVAQFSPERYNVRPTGESDGSGRNGSVQQAAGSDRSTADEDTGVPQYGTAREGAVSVLGYHFSREPRQSLTGEKYGAGIKGAERKRLDNTSDNRLLKRVHFYADSGKGIRPEIGVGNSVHAVQLNNIYDPMVAKLVPYNGNLNDWESAIIDAGFDGYMLDFDDQKAIVLLGPKHSAVPVQLTQEFPRRQPIKQSRKRYQEAFDLARSKKWKNQREFKLALQEGVEPATDSELATELVSDAKFALQSNANAVGWYNNTVTKALKVLSTLHPEIATDANKRFAFIWALAVTSNGLKVDKNFELANIAYEQFKRTGRMPSNVGIGNASAAINDGLQMYNDIVEKFGVDQARKFMISEFSVKQIEQITGETVGGEFKDTAVRGAAILGPKIGNGFYANLNKLFDQLTMDRWLMRTWGRLTGTLVTPNEANIATGRDRTAKAIKAVSKLKTAKVAFDELLKLDISIASIEQVAEAIKKASMKPENRAKMNKTLAGQELRKAGNSLAGNLDAQKEAPSGPGERNQIRAVFGDTLRQLQQEPETKDLNMSDLQALLWYAEKRLYDTAGTAEDTSEGYADDEAPDYANAAVKLAMANGVPRAKIDQVIGVQSEDSSTNARRRDDQASQESQQTEGRSGAAQGFTDRERTQFIRRTLVHRFRRSNRAGNEESSGAYKRNSGGNGKGLRVLGQPSLAVYSPETKFKNALQVAGRSAPKIYETRDAEGFLNSITEAKNETKFGAAVHVYSSGEYGDMRLFLTQNGEAGFALKDDGDIVSVFGSRKFPGAVDAMLQLAIQEGGKKLDAFHTVLPELYSPHGFKVVARTAWNDDYAPEGWDKQKFKEFNGGSPDVVFMVYDPDYFGAYERGSIPFSQSYDAAVETQLAAVAEVEQKGNAQPGQAQVPQFSRNRQPIEIKSKGKDWFEAKAGARTVGKLAVWKDARGKLVAMNVFVSPQYRQRGVATAMYRAAEEANGEQLTPAISLSDEAFEFWKRYRPEAVSKDLRHWKDQIIGAKAVWKNKPGTIIKASGGTATIEFDEPFENGATQSTILRDQLNSALEDGGSPTIDFSTFPNGFAGQGTRFSRNRQTDTPEFKRWFGNSKVVDSDGQPLVVYHGTESDTSKLTSLVNWASEQPDLANAYAASGRSDSGNPNVMPLYMVANNPVLLGPVGNRMSLADLQAKVGFEFAPREYADNNLHSVYRMVNTPEFVSAAKSAGFDSVFGYESGRRTWGVFEPTQIKSAISNNGQFDPANPGIRRSRIRSPIGFYNKLDEAVEKAPKFLKTGDQWAQWVTGGKLRELGVKQEEIEWSGLKDFLMLKGKDPVELADVQEYLRNNGVQVEEVVQRDTTDAAVDVVAVANRYGYDAQPFDGQMEFYSQETQEPVDFEELPEAMQSELMALDAAPGPRTGYRQYTLPGGKNYREVLLTLPAEDSLFYRVENGSYLSPRFETKAEAEAHMKAFPAELRASNRSDKSSLLSSFSVDPLTVNEYKDFVSGKNYKSSHWDAPNVLAHLRLNDRTDSTGAKVLFVEEIQSDWGQEGKKKGFKERTEPAPTALEVRRDEQNSYTDRQGRTFEWGVYERGALVSGMFESAELAEAERTNLRGVMTIKAVPVAPFVTDTKGWLNLALKRIITIAAQEGYDKVAFINGEQSADRYDLSKQVDSISWAETQDGKFNVAAFKDGSRMTGQDGLSVDQLEDMLGKDVAAKIVESSKTEVAGELTGVDLKVGGKGMIAFYDKIVPQEVRGLIKKFDGMMTPVSLTVESEKTGNDIDREAQQYFGMTSNQWNNQLSSERQKKIDEYRATIVPDSMVQPGFTVTDKMKEVVAKEGLPLFSRKRETQQAYDSRIDELLNGARPNRVGVKVLDRSDLLGLLGYPDVPMVLQESKVVPSTVKHNMNADDWKKVPEWLDKPAMVFDSNTVEGRLVFVAPEMKNGKEMLMIVDPDAEVGGSPSQLLVNAYDKTQSPPIDNWVADGLLRYVDKKLSASVLATSGLQLPRVLQKQKRLHGIVPTEDNLVNYVGNIQQSRPRFSPGVKPSGRESFKLADSSKYEDILYKLQDKNIDLKRVTEAVKAKSGELQDEINAYQKEEVYHGRVAKQSEDFLTKELKPLLEEMRIRNVSRKDFETYLWNRHAPERNRQIAKVNDRFPDGGSGIMTADALRYMQGLPANKREQYEILAKRVDKISAENLRMLVETGLETQETVDAMRGSYKAYVPLFRAESSSFTGTGSGYSIKGATTQRALGSDKPVDDILSALATQRDKIITRAEKAVVGRSLMGMALENPQDDFWFVFDPLLNDPKKNPGQAIELRNQLERMGVDPDLADEVTKQPYEEYIAPNGRVAKRPNRKLTQIPNAFGVRVDGQDKFIVFNQENDRARRMAEAITNFDSPQMGAIMGISAQFSRYFASINTQYNPVFGAFNFLRDVQGALLNLSTTELAGEQKKVLAGASPKKLYEIAKYVRARRDGRTPTGEWAAMYERFLNAGGQTGFRDMFETPAERTKKQIDRELDPSAWFQAVDKSAGPVFRWLSDYNEVLENAVRVSAFSAALDKGMSEDKAASLAKNLTVNFNRKGQIGTQAGALYAFFNAAVQGNARLMETLKGPTGKKILAGGILLGAIQPIMLAMAGFDEEQPPDFIRERSIIIPTGDGDYFSWPMPLGFHVIPNVGRIITEQLMGRTQDNVVESFGKMLLTVSQAFNPIGAGTLAQTVTPTPFDPIMALSENKDGMGRSISREDFNPNKPTPGYTRSRDNTPELLSDLAYGINVLTGGTAYTQGIVSPTGDQLDYLLGQFTGGVGREISKSIQFMETQFTGEELPSYKVPLFGKFYGETQSQAGQVGVFYGNMRTMNDHKLEILGRAEAGEDYQSYLAENPEARLFRAAEQVERQIQKLNERKRMLKDAEASPEEIKRIEETIRMVASNFNAQVRAAREASRQ